MRFGKFATAATVLSLIGSPVLAQAANPAAKLSVARARAGATVNDKSDLAGGSLIIAVLAAAAVVAGIIVAADSSDGPNSP